MHLRLLPADIFEKLCTYLDLESILALEDAIQLPLFFEILHIKEPSNTSLMTILDRVEDSHLREIKGLSLDTGIPIDSSTLNWILNLENLCSLNLENNPLYEDHIIMILCHFPCLRFVNFIALKSTKSFDLQLESKSAVCPLKHCKIISRHTLSDQLTEILSSLYNLESLVLISAYYTSRINPLKVNWPFLNNVEMTLSYLPLLLHSQSFISFFFRLKCVITSENVPYFVISDLQFLREYRGIELCGELLSVDIYHKLNLSVYFYRLLIPDIEFFDAVFGLKSFFIPIPIVLDVLHLENYMEYFELSINDTIKIAKMLTNLSFKDHISMHNFMQFIKDVKCRGELAELPCPTNLNSESFKNYHLISMDMCANMASNSVRDCKNLMVFDGLRSNYSQTDCELSGLFKYTTKLERLSLRRVIGLRGYCLSPLFYFCQYLHKLNITEDYNGGSSKYHLNHDWYKHLVHAKNLNTLTFSSYYGVFHSSMINAFSACSCLSNIFIEIKQDSTHKCQRNEFVKRMQGYAESCVNLKIFFVVSRTLPEKLICDYETSNRIVQVVSHQNFSYVVRNSDVIYSKLCFLGVDSFIL